MLLGLLAPIFFFPSTLLAADIADGLLPLGPLISHAKPYHCLQGQIPGVRSLHQPDNSDCAHALDQILKADKAEAPMLISQTQGYTVPHTWAHGSCAIYVNLSEGLSTKPVTLPLTAVVRISLVIMSHCVLDGPKLGGTSFLGSWDDSGGVLDVIIFGRDSSLYDYDLPSWARMAAAIDRSYGTAGLESA